jgi:hypothetical protein
LGRNGFLVAACVAAAVLQLVIPYVGPLAEAFRATPLDPVDLMLVAVVAVGPAMVADLIRRQGRTVWVA